MMMLATTRRLIKAHQTHASLVRAPLCLQFSTTHPRVAHLADRASEDASRSPHLMDMLRKAEAHRPQEPSRSSRVFNTSSFGRIQYDPVPPLKITTPTTPLLDVYEYCAGFGIVPNVQIRVQESQVVRRDVGGRGRSVNYCTIELDGYDRDIASESAPDPERALTQATSRFAQVKDAIARAAKQSRLTNDTLDTKLKPLSRHSAWAFEAWLRKKHGLKWGMVWGTSRDRALLGLSNLPFLTMSYKFGNGARCELPVLQAASRAEARSAAVFRMALDICQKRPELLTAFRAQHPDDVENPDLMPYRQNHGSKATTAIAQFKTPHPANLYIARTSHVLMQSVPDLQLSVIHKTPDASRQRRRDRAWSHLTPDMKQRHADQLKHAYDTYERKVQPAILKARAGLPVAAYRRQLLNLVDNDVYSIFIGATGSGKTTQVPHIIFEDWCRRGRGADCNIICTQPRVIAATSVADRVSDEAGSELRNRIGFHVRDQVSTPSPRDGSITFCTTGILLQQIQHEPDYIFDNVSHLILDEVHERDMVLDFTLAILKRAISNRLARNLKVPHILLMSATLDEESFARYFQNVGSDGQLVNAPSLSVPGRTFPVQEKYLEDVLTDMDRAHSQRDLLPFRSQPTYVKGALNHIQAELETESSPTAAFSRSSRDTATREIKDGSSPAELDWENLSEAVTPVALVAETIAHVLRTTSTGAVLIFLPGLTEIRKVEEILRTNRPLNINIDNGFKYQLFQLHSSLPNSQKSVFQPVPNGVRKVILSSPIAETSVTIPDVTVVIDSGQVRETQYDHTSRASWLRNSWINASSAKQRAGRAGRVQPGTYLALYSRKRRETMPAVGVPEVMRSDLQSTCLIVKSKFQDIDVSDFLASALDPPPAASVQDAMHSLVDTGALTPNHDLTSLGHLLSQIQIHPSLAKMVMLGIVFKCLDPIIVAGAALEQNDLWFSKMGTERAVDASKHYFADGSESDLIATYNAYSYIKKNIAKTPNASERAMQENFSWMAYKRINVAVKFLKTNFRERRILPPSAIEAPDDRIGGEALNENSHKYHVVKAVLMAGLQSNIAALERDASWSALGDRPNAGFANSCLFVSKKNRPKTKNTLFAFGQLEATKSGYVMRHVSTVSPLTVALFCSTLTTDSMRKTPVFLANQVFPLPLTPWAATVADTPTKKDAWAVLRSFRMQLDQVLAVRFDMMAGALVAPHVVDKVDDFLDRVVQVLDSEVRSEPKKAVWVRDTSRREADERKAMKKAAQETSQRVSQQSKLVRRAEMLRRAEQELLRRAAEKHTRAMNRQKAAANAAKAVVDNVTKAVNPSRRQAKEAGQGRGSGKEGSTKSTRSVKQRQKYY